METFGILETWSLSRGGSLHEVVATRGLSVFVFSIATLYCPVM